MRQLLPHPADEVDVAAAYAVDRPAVADRPWVAALMVSTADGAATVDGLSGALGGEGDREVFAAVRAVADAVVVGAGTVTAEGYGPVRLSDEAVAARRARGQADDPQLVVVSGRLSLDPWHAVLDGPRVVVVHGPDAAPERVAALGERADLVAAPAGADGGVDPAAVLAAVHDRGHRVAVVEGGPTLLGACVDADLVDEVCLTLDPRVVGGGAPRIVASDGDGHARAWRTAHLLEHGDALFWRLLRDRDESAGAAARAASVSPGGRSGSP